MEATTSCGGRPARARFTAEPITVKALCQVGAVQFIAFEAVTAGAINQVGAGKLAIVRSGISVMIVGRDHYQRNVLDRGDVHSFMGGAGLHSPSPIVVSPIKFFSPRPRFAMSEPTTTETIAPRWLIIASWPSRGLPR